MDDEVTISCPNHHQSLVGRLWNYCLSGRGVDFDVQCGAGRSIRAHHLILDLFLSPEKLNQSAQHHQQHGESIECLLEFLYSGEVTVCRDLFEILLKVARESEFEILVDVLESKFQDHFAENSFSNAVVEHEARPNFTEQNDNLFVDSPNGSGIIAESENIYDQQCDWQVKTIKLEPAEVNQSQIVDSDSRYPLNISVHEKQTDDQLNYNKIQQYISPPNLIDPETKETCNGQNPDTGENAGLPCTIALQNDKQPGLTNDHHVPEGPLPQGDPLMISSSPNLIGNAAPLKRSRRVRKGKVKLDHNTDVTELPRRSSRNYKRAKFDVEPADITPSHIGEQDSHYQLDIINADGKQMDNQFHCTAIRQFIPPKNLIERKIKKTCDGQDPETRHNARLPCSIGPSRSTNGEFDGIINGELEDTLPEPQGESDPNVSSMGPSNADGVSEGVPPTTSSGSNSAGSPTPEENMEQFDFRVRKIKVEPDQNPDGTNPKRRPPRIAKRANADVTKPSRRCGRISKNPKIVNSHACKDCDKRFDSKGHLVMHMRIHTNENPYTCSVCKKSFNQEGNMKRHLLQHTGERPYKCQQCSKGFVDKTSLTIHERNQHGPLSFQCKEAGCSTTFAHLNDFTVHRKTEHPDVPPKHQCHLCEQAFYFPAHLKFHLRDHRGKKVTKVIKVKTIPCDSCSKMFREKTELVIHSRIHTGLKPYTCPHCEKAFSQKAHLTTHLRMHTKERPYRCDHEGCDKTYQQSAHLTHHKLTHAGIKAFACTHPKCKNKYYTQSYLNRHRRLRHGKKRSFVCEHCGSSYRDRKNLNRHMRKKHAAENDEERHHCDICGETFDDLETLNLHADTHV